MAQLQSPTRRGFGGRIIEQMIGQLKGDTHFDWRAEGSSAKSHLECEQAISKGQPVRMMSAGFFISAANLHPVARCNLLHDPLQLGVKVHDELDEAHPLSTAAAQIRPSNTRMITITSISPRPPPG